MKGNFTMTLLKNLLFPFCLCAMMALPVLGQGIDDWAKAEQNGEQARKALLHCRQFVYAWLDHADPSENHILRNSAFIREAVYSPNGIRYETVSPGEEYLKVYKKPGTIFVDGAPLPQLEKWGYREEGWWYDESSHLLKVAHRRTRIKINF